MLQLRWSGLTPSRWLERVRIPLEVSHVLKRLGVKPLHLQSSRAAPSTVQLEMPMNFRALLCSRFEAIGRNLLFLIGFQVVPGIVPAAETSPRILLLDAAVVGSEVVAVGERGAILRSADNGKTWQPSVSPSRATLTAVSFAASSAPRPGWAVGHDAQILTTADAGQTWTKQYQGEDLQDSFLDVLAIDAQRVIAVGAYGLCVVTADGGRTWTRRKFSDDDYHFNRISRGPTGTLYLAGEHGTLLQSTDAGQTWTSMGRPYAGSFYGVLTVDRSVLLAHGLRGRIFLSLDAGESWQPVATPEAVLIASAIKLRSNHLVFAGSGNALLVSHDLGYTVKATALPTPAAIAEIIELPDGNLLALGEAGAMVLPKP
jgi:photosystem II stability/assembly factor-like uncharacterized protein